MKVLKSTDDMMAEKFISENPTRINYKFQLKPCSVYKDLFLIEQKIISFWMKKENLVSSIKTNSATDISLVFFHRNISDAAISSYTYRR
jgi:hypothetical protein